MTYKDKNSKEGNARRCRKWKQTHRKAWNAYMREYMRVRRGVVNK